MPVKGEIPVQVHYKDQVLSLSPWFEKRTIIAGQRLAESLRLDWKMIGLARASSSQQSQVDILLKEYDDVFRDGLGSMPHFKARLTSGRAAYQSSTDHDLCHLQLESIDGNLTVWRKKDR